MQAEQSLWVYDCEKILLGCPTAEGLGLTQGAYLWISLSGDPDQDPVIPKISCSHS